MTIWPPDHWAALPGEITAPDIEGAKALMAEAGLADGFTTTLTSWSDLKSPAWNSYAPEGSPFLAWVGAMRTCSGHSSFPNTVLIRAPSNQPSSLPAIRRRRSLAW